MAKIGFPMVVLIALAVSGCCRKDCEAAAYTNEDRAFLQNFGVSENDVTENTNLGNPV